MAKFVYDLWYEREYDYREDTELHIGIYSSEAEAKTAIERLRGQTGFCDYPEGFNIHPVELDRDGWVEGFVPILEGEMVEQGFAPSKPNALDMPAWFMRRK